MKRVVVLLLFLEIFLFTGCSVKELKELTDADKFAKEHNVSNDNPFCYLEEEDLLEFVQEKTGIVVFGNSNDDSTQQIITLWMEMGKKEKIEKIYYVELSRLSKEVQKTLEESLKDHLTIGTKTRKLLSGEVFFFQNGTVIAHDSEIALLKKEENDYLSEKAKKEWKRRCVEAITKYRSCYDKRV